MSGEGVGAVRHAHTRAPGEPALTSGFHQTTPLSPGGTLGLACAGAPSRSALLTREVTPGDATPRNALPRSREHVDLGPAPGLGRGDPVLPVRPRRRPGAVERLARGLRPGDRHLPDAVRRAPGAG